MSLRTQIDCAKELGNLDRCIAQMGGLVEILLWQAFEALDRRNPQLAEQTVLRDGVIDLIERDVLQKAVAVIGELPIPGDLRHVVAVMAIATDLERIGDLSKSIARSASLISGLEQPRDILHGFKHLTEIAAHQLKIVLDAWMLKDSEGALSARSRVAELRALHNSVCQDLMIWMAADPRHIEHGMQLMLIAKSLERIGDHATNIAERVAFSGAGRLAAPDRYAIGNASPPLTTTSAA